MRSLQLENIQKKFRQTAVLKGIDLQIEKGQICALTGESGSGKTTLLRIIAGLETSDHGKILLGGEDITFKKPEHRNIGLVFQQLALFPHLNVDQNIGFGIRSRSGRYARVEELKSLTGLHELGDRYPHELSGGQQQRVALARALANAPQVLLLDEPFSNLDEITKAKIRIELVTLIKEIGITAIVVTHHPADAFMISDQIVILQDGKILQQGTPNHLYDHPVSSYVSEYFGAGLVLSGTAGENEIKTGFGNIPFDRKLPGSSFTLFIRPEHVSILPKSAHGLCARIRHKIFKGPHEVLVLENLKGDQLLELETEQSSLSPGDEIFLKPDPAKISFFST